MFLLFLGGIILTIGDIFIKKWTIDNNVLNFLSGMALWIVALLLLAYTFKFMNVVSATFIEVLVNVITLVVADLLFFKDPITWLEIIGILLGMVSIYILELI